MVKNFFKTTIRNLWKDKTYTFINIFGLAIGIACASLYFLWVEDEVNYNAFNEKRQAFFLYAKTSFTMAIREHLDQHLAYTKVIQSFYPTTL